ncbi:MAG TPA: hypothetical protein VME43_20085, partial [Bryobacteraceae bacterium]|nr:hypothetical protein [Bryobacteraceae bacterium]
MTYPLTPLPLESALLLRAAATLVPEEIREEWRREWHAELWWWLSSTPEPARLALAGHCTGAVADAFWLRAGEGFRVSHFLERPGVRVALPTLLLAILAAVSGGFRETRRALFTRVSDDLAILTETGPFMGQMRPLPAARVAEWRVRSHTVESIQTVSRLKALVRLKRGATVAQARAELRVGNDFLDVTPYAAEIGRPVAVLGPPFLALVLLALAVWLWSAPSRAYSLAHPLAWLAVLFLAALETPANPVAISLPYLAASFLAL